MKLLKRTYKILGLIVAIAIAIALVARTPGELKSPGIPISIGVPPLRDLPAVHVEPVSLTEVSERILSGLNVGAVVAHRELADGIQKAADVWGLHVDLFVVEDPQQRESVLVELAQNGEAALIFEELPESTVLTRVITESNRRRGGGLGPLPVVTFSPSQLATDVVAPDKDLFRAGFNAIRVSRARLLPLIPKYDQLFSIGFPITPLPDTFFQPTKFPYPEPLVRSVRTVSSVSASAHAHTSCHAFARLGNMLHPTSKVDPETLLLGFEGGNLSVKASPGAITPKKLSAVMTAYVFAFRGQAGEARDLLSENDGLETSQFKPAIHAPEELAAALNQWKERGLIQGFNREGPDEVILDGFKGAKRRFRAGFFMVSSDRNLSGPNLEIGSDRYGRWTLEFTSMQRFIQLFTEVPLSSLAQRATKPDDSLRHLKLAERTELENIKPSGALRIGEPLLAEPQTPRGGLLNEAGTSVGTTVGFPLGSILQRVPDRAPRFQPYIVAMEGGFLVVTPEIPLSEDLLAIPIERIDFDERGPLGSDQTLTVKLMTGKSVVFRRTILNFGYLDEALSDVERQGWFSGWEYVGARGQGLASNVVLHNFLGKHRKFMSSLNTWPSYDRPRRPYIRWYVDGMQRLNFSLVTPEGWRQEFVEIPVLIPPIPRDVELFSGISKLD